MAKRVKTSSFRAKRLKACQGRKLLEDRITELPDGIIFYILSLLSMKEAGRTCVLSKRWRYLWAYVPVLNFDGTKTLDNIMLGKELFHKAKPRFLRWVNQVVGSYKGQTIDEFRVRFDFSATSRYSINNWVEFAIEKRVKRLELDFFPDERDLYCRCYTFRGSLISNSLTSLKLVSVNVSGNVLQNCLGNCPNLEYLSVKQSQSLINLLVVTGEALNLRYLELLKCFYVKHVEISAPNLVSFSYFGPKIGVPLKMTPKLSNLSLGGNCGKYLISNSLEFSSYLFQLEAFRLDLRYENLKVRAFYFSLILAFCFYDLIKLSKQLVFIIHNVMKSADQFPVCTRLKQLELVVSPEINGDLICLAKMLKACPFLHKFVLTVRWCNYIKSKWFEVEDCRYYKLNMWELETRPHYHVNEYVDELVLESCPHQKVKRWEPEACPHYQLKTVEIVGFVGDSLELEFIIYLMENCIALEKFVIDRSDVLLAGTKWELEAKEREVTTRKKAEQLRPKVKPGTDFVIL